MGGFPLGFSRLVGIGGGSRGVLERAGDSYGHGLAGAEQGTAFPSWRICSPRRAGQ